jgi:hypothetical protein
MPTNPITGILFHKGGMRECIMRDDPIIKAASMMAEASRLLTTSSMCSMGWRPFHLNNYFALFDAVDYFFQISRQVLL